jgi:hypothetical protein
MAVKISTKFAAKRTGDMIEGVAEIFRQVESNSKSWHR